MMRGFRHISYCLSSRAERKAASRRRSPEKPKALAHNILWASAPIHGPC